MKLAVRWVMCVFVVWLGASAQRAPAQAKPDSPDVYGSRNTFGIVAEYSNDSSHIILGAFNNVKLGAIGLQYQRRLIANRAMVWSYTMEFRPAIMESIPTETDTNVGTSPYSFSDSNPPYLTEKCNAGAFPYKYSVGLPPVTVAGTLYVRCGRQMNYAQGFSPFGVRISLRSGHRLQPTFSSLEGYILSTRPLPIANAGSFNFCFDVAAGLEYHPPAHRSIRLEYAVQHYSNKDSAYENPGVDNGTFKLTYSFGR